jgi:hypothetical protein
VHTRFFFFFVCLLVHFCLVGHETYHIVVGRTLHFNGTIFQPPPSFYFSVRTTKTKIPTYHALQHWPCPSSQPCLCQILTTQYLTSMAQFPSIARTCPNQPSSSGFCLFVFVHYWHPESVSPQQYQIQIPMDPPPHGIQPCMQSFSASENDPLMA